MGSRFKAKRVLGAMGSFAPAGRVHVLLQLRAREVRTLNAWFPRPLEVANEESQQLLQDMRKTGSGHLGDIAARAAKTGSPDEAFLQTSWSVDASWQANSHGDVSHGVAYTNRTSNEPAAQSPASQPIHPQPAKVLSSGAEFWRNGNDLYLVATAPLKDGKLYVARKIPSDYLDRAAEIQAQTQTYEE